MDKAVGYPLSSSVSLLSPIDERGTSTCPYPMSHLLLYDARGKTNIKPDYNGAKEHVYKEYSVKKREQPS